MKKTKQTNTKLLVIAVAAIIAAATITTSISVARPAFAKGNCTITSGVQTCSGGGSFKTAGIDVPGGGGGHSTYDTSTGALTASGGGGGNDGTLVGGGGGREVCDPSGSCQPVGGSGQHPK